MCVCGIIELILLKFDTNITLLEEDTESQYFGRLNHPNSYISTSTSIINTNQQFAQKYNIWQKIHVIYKTVFVKLRYLLFSTSLFHSA